MEQPPGALHLNFAKRHDILHSYMSTPASLPGWAAAEDPALTAWGDLGRNTFLGSLLEPPPPPLYDAFDRPLPAPQARGDTQAFQIRAFRPPMLQPTTTPTPHSAGAANEPARPPPAQEAIPFPKSKRVTVQCIQCGCSIPFDRTEEATEPDLVRVVVPPFCQCVVDAAADVVRRNVGTGPEAASRTGSLQALEGGNESNGQPRPAGHLRLVQEPPTDE